MKTWNPVANGTALAIYTCNGRCWAGRLMSFNERSSGLGVGIVRLSSDKSPDGFIDIDLESIVAVERGSHVTKYVGE